MLVNDGGIATQPKAPGHDRPFTASPGAAKHGRLSAATRAPSADVPPATTAEAPGQYRLSAALLAPGHDRPRAALRAPRHGRPSADVPPAIPAEAPGQYCLCAALLAPGHDRPRAALRAPRHGRPSADVPPAIPAEAPGQYCLCAALLAPGHDRPRAALRAPRHGRPSAVAIATVALPASQHRPRQEGLPRVPANPRTLTYSPAHQDSTHTRTTDFRAIPSPRGAGGLQGGQSQSSPRPAARRSADSPPLAGKGPGVRSPSHQVHPAIQVPPKPRPCSTTDTGLLRQHPSRAPPTTARRP